MASSVKKSAKPIISPQRKKGRRHLLTVLPMRAIKQMITRIRAGAYDWVAAQSVGVDPNTFIRWMNEGSRETAEAPIRQFYLEVCKARADARIRAEIEVKRDNPQFWLRCGPGKTKPNQPGWTDDPKDSVGNSLLGVDDSSLLDNPNDEQSQQITVIQNQQILVMGNALKILTDLGLIKPGEQVNPIHLGNGNSQPLTESQNGSVNGKHE